MVNLLIGKSPELPKGLFQVYICIQVIEPGEMVSPEIIHLLFVGDGSLAGDLIDLGVIKSIIAHGGQCFLFINENDELPGFTIIE